MTEIDMTGLLLKLADLGITGIKVKYEGAGDSGAIEWIGYTNKPCETPEDVNDNIDDWENDWLLSKISQDAYTEIEEFAYNRLLDDIEDWCNNEGGYGNLCIVVPSGKYEINNNIKIVHTEYYLHEGNLIDKAVNK